MRWRGPFLIACLFAGMIFGCETPTEIVLVVDADDALSVERLRVSALSTGEPVEVELDGALARPWTLGIAGRGGAPLTVEITAATGDGPITARARTRFVERERRMLQVYLSRACAGVSCPAEQTCDPSGACEGVDREPCPFRDPPPRGEPERCEPGPDSDGGQRDGGPDADADVPGWPLPTRCPSETCEVAAGARHACALESNGSVSCWGSNDAGELGTSGTARGLRLAVDGIGSALRLTAGRHFTCALAEHGADDTRVWCWGANDRFQLGLTGPSTATPGMVPLPDGRPVIALDAGDAFTCALRADGEVLCWGDNQDGQLAREPSLPRTGEEAQRVELPFAAIGIAAGGAQACAWNDAELRCWGASVTAMPSSPVPALVLGLSEVESMSLGRAHRCAIAEGSAGRALYCWGDSSSGQGGSSTALLLGPHLVDTLPADAVSAGADHTCVLGAGRRRCFGRNAERSLATASADVVVSSPVEVGGEGTWRQIAAGDHFTCGVLDGAVHCFGWDLAGAVGRAGILDQAEPSRVELVSSSLRSLVAGGAHTCVIRDGDELWCWGANDRSQVAAPGAPPAAVPRMLATGVTLASAGGRHSCSVDQSGHLRCWGDNQRGQSGQAPSSPLTPAPPEAPLASGVTAVTLGGEHTCFADASGVLCFGRGDRGQLGTPLTDTHEPRVIAGAPVGLGAPVAGRDHTCAIAGATAFCWGANERGQLGQARSASEPWPTQPDGFSASPAWLALGGAHTCGGSLAEVRCVGADDAGQLGDGDPTEDREVAVVLDLGLPGGESLVALAAGGRHACAGSARSLRCWGANERAQAGAIEDRLTRPAAVSLPEGTTLVELAAGETHTCAVVQRAAQREVWCWGSDEDGRAGRRRELVVTTPWAVQAMRSAPR